MIILVHSNFLVQQLSTLGIGSTTSSQLDDATAQDLEQIYISPTFQGANVETPEHSIMFPFYSQMKQINKQTHLSNLQASTIQKGGQSSIHSY